MFRWRRADELRRLITATRRTGNESSQRESSRTGERKKCQLPHTKHREESVGKRFRDFRINLITSTWAKHAARCTYLSPLKSIIGDDERRRWSAANTHRIKYFRHWTTSFACSRNSTPNRPTTQPKAIFTATKHTFRALYVLLHRQMQVLSRRRRHSSRISW